MFEWGNTGIIVCGVTNTCTPGILGQTPNASSLNQHLVYPSEALTTGSNLGGDLFKLCHSRAELRLCREAADSREGEEGEEGGGGDSQLILPVRESGQENIYLYMT